MPRSKSDGRSKLLAQVEKLAFSDQKCLKVIGIDGPTASGKTTLANWLASELGNRGVPTRTYRLDWCLSERSTRVRDLEILKKSACPFPFEGELHMELGKALRFLTEVRAANEALNEGHGIEKSEVQLENLYSRENGGSCTGKEIFKLEQGMVILLEGHYTLRNEFDALIDFNILLLSDIPELLRRKIARVEGYRASCEVEDYFWRIDLPSFRHHLTRFGWNADLIIDNTDYNAAVIEGDPFLESWLDQSDERKSPIVFTPPPTEISSLVFSDSGLVPELLREQTRLTIDMLRAWDLNVGRYLRTSLSDIQVDLEALAKGLVEKLNSSLVEDTYRVSLEHTDSLHNVYYRKLPLTLGVAIVNTVGEFVVGFIAITNQSELRILVYWAGGQRELLFDRKLGEITNSPETVFRAPSLGERFASNPNSPFRVMLPTHFTVPGFLNGFSYSPVFTGREQENISASEALSSLLREGGVGVHRFALFSEIRFFSFCMDCAGIVNLQAGNYLISLRYPDKLLRTRFKEYANGWRVPIARKGFFLKAQQELDLLARIDKADAEVFVTTKCVEFQMRDGFLFSHFMYGDSRVVENGLLELKEMLGSSNRFLRKRATQFILEYFPGFTVPTSKMWVNIPEGSQEEISLESFNLLCPSILAEVYLWLALRGESAAVLGANIYDIRLKSSDARAYILAASLDHSPVVLQCSLNAVGQEETDLGKKYHGYLLPKQGAKDFVTACNNAVRDLLLTRGISPPLYSLGLDHVSSEHDIPKGRAKRFFQDLLTTRGVTHLVLDGSSRFQAEDRSEESLRQSYNRVAEFAADLIGDPRAVYLVDLEICAGEFNYVGNEKIASLPDVAEMRTFIRCFQNKVMEREAEAVLGRPMLCAANLGTTHHGYDKAPPPVETARLWREALKSENIISAVLHGTSKSHRDVLSRSTSGCHKVNVAGDLLETFVKNLPERIYSKFKRSTDEPKKMLASVREDMNEMTTSELDRLENSLCEHARDLMGTIHSPTLSQMDTNYFRYISYVYTNEQVETVVQRVRSRLQQNNAAQVSKLADSSLARAFSVSMIEVPLDETKGPLSEMLWEGGIRYFHVDAGDGRFISREFSGLEKAAYLREHFPDARIHAHLMMEDPHRSNGLERSAIQKYAEAGCNAIAIHPRAIRHPDEIDTALNLIRTFNCRAGIVLETSDSIDEKIRGLIQRMKIDWAIIMGVPIGYGGQLFQFGTINRIAALNRFANELGRDFLIECDGGLNMETLRFCKNAGAQVFSGWSIIKAASYPEISDKVKQVREALDQ